MPDIVPSVPYEIKLTAAHAGTRPITRGIVLHATRGPTRPRAGETLVDTLHREYLAAVAYMQNAANEVSPHFCVGSKRVARMVPDHLIAWHAQEHNKTHLGIEIAQPAYQPVYVEFQYVAVADICAKWCLKYNIRPIHVTNSDLNGIIGHEETDQGRRDGKSDPGDKWNWTKCIAAVNTRIKELITPPPENEHVFTPTNVSQIPADIRAYIATNGLGSIRLGNGLTYQGPEPLEDWTVRTTGGVSGCVVMKRSYNPPGEETQQIDHIDWLPPKTVEVAKCPMPSADLSLALTSIEEAVAKIKAGHV